MQSEEPNFDRLARPYRWLEYFTFGPFLERCRFHYLNRLSDHRHALILGDGDGRFTTKLLATNPRISVEAVDISTKMLELLIRRVDRLGLAAASRLRTYRAAVQTLNFEAPPYDLIVTHFFLDCLTEGEIAALLRQLTPNMTPGAAWLISEFAIPPSGPMKPLSQLIIATLYCAFRFLSGLKVGRLPNYAHLLQQAGFSRIDQKLHLGGLLVSELWSFDLPL